MLVCTAIIENGVDFPNVNTLIVDQAEMFGLAQLYQLRGRVGRSDRQAYAYLTWKPRKKLTETAQERIAAMKEFSALGSGYKVALRDLEIRGAGNLLGAEQSGVLAAVGYDLYCQMLEEAVRMVKGEQIEPERDIQIDLPLDAFLPGGLRAGAEPAHRPLSPAGGRAPVEIRRRTARGDARPLSASRCPRRWITSSGWSAVKLLCLETGITHIGAERGAIVLRLAPERSLSPQAVKRLQLEAPGWRKRGLPAPAFTPERVTIYTHNVDQHNQPRLLEEIADRLRVIEGEVARSPRLSKPTPPLRREPDYRPFGGR